MMIASLTIPCLTCAMSIAAGDPDGEAISTKEMVAALERQLHALDSMSVSFATEEYSGFGAGSPGPDGVRATDFKLATTGSAIRLGPMYRIELVTTRACDGLATLVGDGAIFTSNGAQGRQVVRRQREHVLISDPAPVFHRHELFHQWLGWNVQNFRVPATYADILGTAVVDGPTLEPDGRTRWRCVPTWSREPCLEVVFWAESRGEPMLVEVALVGYASGVDVRKLEWRTLDEARMSAPRPEVWGSVRFDDRRVEIGDSTLAAGAIVAGHHFRDRPEDEFWGWYRVELREVEPASIDEATFLEPIRTPDATVVDDRYRIAYDLGSTKINIDGRILRTHIPVEGDVGARLEWWIRNGSFVPVPEVPGPEDSP
jgi:hypothetical protein